MDHHVRLWPTCRPAWPRSAQGDGERASCSSAIARARRRIRPLSGRVLVALAQPFRLGLLPDAQPLVAARKRRHPLSHRDHRCTRRLYRRAPSPCHRCGRRLVRDCPARHCIRLLRREDWPLPSAMVALRRRWHAPLSDRRRRHAHASTTLALGGGMPAHLAGGSHSAAQQPSWSTSIRIRW